MNAVYLKLYLNKIQIIEPGLFLVTCDTVVLQQKKNIFHSCTLLFLLILIFIVMASGLDTHIPARLVDLILEARRRNVKESAGEYEMAALFFRGINDEFDIFFDKLVIFRDTVNEDIKTKKFGVILKEVLEGAAETFKYDTDEIAKLSKEVEKITTKLDEKKAELKAKNEEVDELRHQLRDLKRKVRNEQRSRPHRRSRSRSRSRSRI